MYDNDWNRKTNKPLAISLFVLFLAIIIALMWWFGFWSTPAKAAELVSSTTEDDLGGWLPLIHTVVREILAPAATAFLLWLFHKFVHVHNEAGLRDAIGKSVTNAASLVLATADDQIGGAAIDVGSPAMESALAYIKKTAPDAVRHWGIDDGTLEQKIIASIVQLTRGAAVAAVTTSGPVVVAGNEPGPGQLSRR